MQHISLFSGIGGFDLASQWMGWKNIVSCEINPFARRVLEYYWPDAYHHDDIKTLNYEKINEELEKRFGINWRTDDIILTGRFPCQPYSAAGKRLGKNDERHLWPEMLRVIREIQPRWVVGENVFGITNWNGGVVFEEVQSDLESEGYKIQPYVLPACGVNAPHRRDRVWFVARHSESIREAEVGKVFTDGERCEESAHTIGVDSIRRNDDEIWDASHTDGRRFSGSEGDIRREKIEKSTDNASTFGQIKFITQTTGERLQRSSREVIQKRSNGFAGSCENIGNWDEFPTQSPICSRDDGFYTRLDRITFPKWRSESIKAAGNAVVPQVVLQIFKTIEKYESLI